MTEHIPEIVARAYIRSEANGFRCSCEVDVGRLLATLAAAVPRDGRVLELGTGVGVGLAWLVHGLGKRSDVEVVTVELDSELHEITASDAWPPFVRFELGDGAELATQLGDFDLIFADAPGGKLTELHRTIGALRPGGVLLVDDMDLDRHDDPELRRALIRVRENLLSDPQLIACELNAASGMILATRRR
jgi:demethylmenaquinone methyltransferase/2-methoxy-6-polyprenyl-1,4-benzoquinol methylase